MSEQASSPERVLCDSQKSPACHNSSSDAKVNEAGPESKFENVVKNLMILNDHCLLIILDFLELKHLRHVVNVNKRLNALVKLHIRLKYHVRFEPNFDLIPYKGQINVRKAKALFRIFGNEIVKLKLVRDACDGTFNGSQSMRQIFNSLKQYCSNINEFMLQGFDMGGFNGSFFKNLEVLTLERCSISRHWCKMHKLKALRMNGVIFREWPSEYQEHYRFTYSYAPMGLQSVPIPIPVNCFGSLIEVRLTDVKFEANDLEKLIKKNRGIEMLSVIDCSGLSPSFFRALPHLKELEEFEYRNRLKSGAYYSNAFHHLYSLNNLKTLKMQFYGTPPPAIVDGHVEVHSTEDVLRIVEQLKLLEELHIHAKVCMTQDTLKEIVNAANQLTCLKIMASGRFNLDVDTYQAILDTVQKRNGKNTLELTIYGDGKQSLAVPDEILKGENEKWLKVNLLDELTNQS